MPLLDAPTLKQAVADSMQLKNVANLGTQWDNICAMAVDDAQKDIWSLMIGKGYSEADILAWDRLTSVHRLQSLYWAFVHGAGMHNFSDTWVNKLDQRPDMKDCTLLVTSAAGIVQGTGQPGFVIGGRFDTSNDLLTMDTPI